MTWPDKVAPEFVVAGGLDKFPEILGIGGKQRGITVEEEIMLAGVSPQGFFLHIEEFDGHASKVFPGVIQFGCVCETNPGGIGSRGGEQALAQLAGQACLHRECGIKTAQAFQLIEAFDLPGGVTLQTDLLDQFYHGGSVVRLVTLGPLFAQA